MLVSYRSAQPGWAAPLLVVLVAAFTVHWLGPTRSEAGRRSAVRASEVSTITCSLNRPVVTASRAATLRAAIEPTHTAQANVRLQVSRSGTGWVDGGTMVFNAATGRYVRSVRPSRRMFYRAWWGGDGDHSGDVSAAIRVDVRPRLTLHLSRRVIRWGRQVILQGSVWPSHPRRVVRIQRRGSAGWRTTHRLRLTRRSGFLAALEPGTKGIWRLRATLAKPDVDHLAAISASRNVRVVQGRGRSEARALWVTRWQYESPRDVKRIMRRAADAHLNVVYFQVRGQGDAYYASHYEPWAESLAGRLGRRPRWDPLAVAVSAAHANGIKLHAWMNAYSMWQGDRPPPRTRPLHWYHKRGWRVASRYRVRGRWRYHTQRLGEDEYLWASPGNPGVRDHIVRVAVDLVSNYNVDGLHLDRLRYPGPQYSWDAGSRAAYAVANRAYRKAHHGRRLSRAAWQRRRIDDLVGRINRGVKAVNPRVQLTVAAWGIYTNRWGWPRVSDGLVDYYQDSQRWARRGIVDALAPMTYWDIQHVPKWGVLVRDFVRHQGRAFIWPGIAAYSYTDRWSEVGRQVRLSRRLGARGVSFYDYESLRGRWGSIRQLFPVRVDPPMRGAATALQVDASPTTVRVGGPVVISGRVRPSHRWATVRLRRFAATRWDLVTSQKMDSFSRFRFVFRPRVAGRFRLRVVFGGDRGHAGRASRDLVIVCRP